MFCQTAVQCVPPGVLLVSNGQLNFRGLLNLISFDIQFRGENDILAILHIFAAVGH